MKGRDVRDLIRREVDGAEYERIRALWKKHSIAEDARDIPGLLSTLTEDCVYELVPEQRTWLGHAGATAFYKELLGAFPDIKFELTDIVIGPQGVCEEARATATHSGPWLGRQPTGKPVLFRVAIFFPWDPDKERFTGERIFTDPPVLIYPSRRSREVSYGAFDE
jgi:predicted ester cyclase